MAAKPAKERLTAARKVIRDLVEQFPDAPSLTLAKRAYREHPELWPNLEACRSAIRTVLGVNGESQRSNTTDKSQYRKPRAAGWKDVIPQALVQLEDWGAFEIPGKHKALVLNDLHIPYHSMSNLSLAIQHGADRKPDLVIINGDGVDHCRISRWEQDPRERRFPEEVRDTKFFLRGLRQRFKDARIVYKWGNHEERWDAYMRMKCPEFLGIPEFEWESVFGLAELRIELVRDKKPIRLGELNILHGHEYTFNINNPVNPARGLFLRAKTHVLGGHFHQTSQHSEKSLEQKVISSWSVGCLCDLTPRYRPLNPWNAGFAFVETDKAGAFHVDNLRIVDGKVW